MLGLGLGVDRASFVAAGFDADYQAVLDRGTTLGYALPTGNALSGGDTLVKSLKSAGIWNKLDIFYVFATNGDSDFATLNWKTPASFQATKVNSPTFTSLEGFTGNGTTSYLNTNWRPNPDGVNYQINSASLAFYSRSDRTDNIDIGTRVSGTDSNIFMSSKNTATTGNSTINSTDNAPQNFSNTDGSGFYIADRNNSANHTIYKNGASVSTFTKASELNAAPALFVGALNQAGTPIVFSQKQFSIVAAGASLASEASDFFTAIEAYMDAIGKGVVA